MDNDTPELFDSEPVAVKLTVADGRDGDISNDDIRDGDISNDDIREGGPPVNAEDGSNAIDDKSDGMIRRENVVEYRTDDDDDDDGIYDRSAEDTDRPAGRVVDGDSSKTTENVRHKGLPPGRVKLIMKMDPDVNIVAGEAVYLVTKATVKKKHEFYRHVS